MKLNPNCVRDVLLYLEENLTLIHHNTDEKRIQHKTASIFDIAQTMTKDPYDYEYDDALYTIEKLIETDYIKCINVKYGINQSIISGEVSDITYEGHNFLNTIRPKSIWDATLSSARKIGSTSIRTLSMLSTEIVKAIVTNPIMIQDIIEKIQ